MSDSLCFDRRRWTTAELETRTKPFEIGGSVDLRGYAHPLPASLTSIGGYVDLQGYAHPLPVWLIAGGVDSRGYSFNGHFENGEWRVHAGCRNLTIPEARAHWGPDGPSDRPDCLALVEKIAAEIERRENAR